MRVLHCLNYNCEKWMIHDSSRGSQIPIAFASLRTRFHGTSSSDHLIHSGKPSPYLSSPSEIYRNVGTYAQTYSRFRSIGLYSRKFIVWTATFFHKIIACGKLCHTKQLYLLWVNLTSVIWPYWNLWARLQSLAIFFTVMQNFMRHTNLLSSFNAALYFLMLCSTC